MTTEGSSSESSEYDEEAEDDEEDEHNGGRAHGHRNENIDDEAFEVNEEDAEAEEDAISWKHYGSGYDTDENVSSGTDPDSDEDSDYFPGKDGIPPTEDEGE